MTAFFVFNICYSKGCFNFCTVLEIVLLNVKHSKPNTTVSNLCLVFQLNLHAVSLLMTCVFAGFVGIIIILYHFIEDYTSLCVLATLICVCLPHHLKCGRHTQISRCAGNPMRCAGWDGTGTPCLVCSTHLIFYSVVVLITISFSLGSVIY